MSNKYKVRTRFNIVDIAMLCDTLRKTILGTRISNIYDCQPTSMSPRSYVIKLSGTPICAPQSSTSTQPTVTATAEDSATTNTKHMLLLDPPCRMHVTEYVRPKKDVPSVLSLKLRKYIRGKRLEKIAQLGIDRVVQLTFGVGESSFNLIVELYAQGNIVLTDNTYSILAVLRHHDYGDGSSIAVKSVYPLSFVKHLPNDDPTLLVENAIADITVKLIAVKKKDDDNDDVIVEEAKTAATDNSNGNDNEENEGNDDNDNDNEDDNKKKGKKGGNKSVNKKKKQQQQQQKKKVNDGKGGRNAEVSYSTVDIVKNIVDFGVHYNNEIVLSAKSIADPERNLLKAPLTDPEKADLAASLNTHFAEFKQMHAATTGALRPGWVLLRPPIADEESGSGSGGSGSGGAKESKENRYYDFAPLEYADCAGVEQEVFSNFSVALDHFFTHLEVAQMARQQASLESQMGRKLEKLKRDQEERVASLEEAGERLRRNATLIEYNIALVDQAINELRTVIASGLSWGEIELMVKTLKKTDPGSIANIIHHLTLAENRAFLLLSEPAEDDDAERDTTPVPVDLSLSAHGNIEACYTERSAWLSKARKTTDVAEQVIEKAEKKYKTDLRKARTSAAVTAAGGGTGGGFLQARKKFWFEKFNWFVSAEGLVVVSGKDAQQNETLYKRYMRQTDLYVHADIHGAATCIVRSRPDVNGGAVGPVTLEQAGRFAMCRSNAWSSKLVTSAWWVYPAQVSKSAPTGEYLTTGSFMIRGKKNFLPPHQLVMGFGILFLLDPSSIEAHKDDAIFGGHNNNNNGDGDNGSSSSLLDSAEVSSSSSLAESDSSSAIVASREQSAASLDESSVVTHVESDMPEPTAKEEDWSSMAESSVLSAEPSEESKMEDCDNEMVEGSEEPTITVTTTAAATTPEAQKSLVVPSKNKYFDNDEESVDGNEENNENDLVEELMKPGKKGTTKAKMSAHARRALKKGIDPTQKSTQQQQEQEAAGKKKLQKKGKGKGGRGDDDGDDDDDSKAKQEATTKQKPKLSKAKLKKMKKYADQDEEDKRIRMMLIGHAPKEEEPNGDDNDDDDSVLVLSGSGSKLSGTKDSKKKKKDQQQQQQTKACFICGSKDHYARDCPKKKLEEQTADAKSAAPVANNDAIDADDDDDDDNDDGTVGSNNNNNNSGGSSNNSTGSGPYSDGIERLTATPRSDDILLHAIPVCAPYDALQHYKYKVKLTPGHLKRGKAVDSAIQLFLKQQDITEQEKRLIKAIPNDDLLQCMLSDVTVAGGQASARLKKLKKK